METQHTPGEWHAKDGQIYETEKGRTLALIPYFDSNFEEDKANQNLIAAAPDLLEALKDCQEWFILNFKSKKIPMEGVGSPGCLQTMKAAINKAIGE